jgi:hypothetical protein
MTSEASSNENELSAALDRLIRIPDCVLSFDKSLVELLPELLIEQYGLRPGEDHRNPDLSFIMRWFETKTGKAVSFGDLPGLLKEAGLDTPRYRPPLATDGLSEEFESWSTATATQSLKDALVLQKDLGQGTYRAMQKPYDPNARGGATLRSYLQSVTTPRPGPLERVLRLSFWEVKIKLWRLLGLVSANKPSLSVGPRWNTEVKFFREIVGLRQHIGLDLSSSDPELIKTGDMHNMPLASDTYNFIFVKNTADKSYEIRKFVGELVRVAAPNGIIVIDQICGHGAVSPIHRTDVQKARNLLKLFQAQVAVKPLVCTDIDVRPLSRDGSTNNARLAVQVLKNSTRCC